MDLQQLWIVGGALALVGVVALVGSWRERKRTAALEAVALRLGLSFREKDESAGSEAFARLPLFQRGRARRFRNVARSGDVWAFGYRYTTGSGKNSSTHRQTVVAVRRASGALPAFELAPEGVFDRIGAAFGGQDIDFDEDPEFSRRFRLRGRDEAAVRALLDAGLRQELTSEPGWCIEGEGEWLVLYRRGKRIAPDELGTLVERARRLAALLPSP